MLDRFESSVLETIRKYDMVKEGDRVLVCVSGGPDSLALLMCLHNLRQVLGIDILVAHLHHMIRGEEADEDAAYVKKVADDLGHLFVIDHADVPGIAKSRGIGIEEAGRWARYAFFERTAGSEGCSRIALGHNKDDQAETVLMRLFRGAGPDGLGGIPPVRGKIIRPLINIYRAQIEVYCNAAGFKPRVDRTNLDTTYTRNKIRYHLMPLLEREYNVNLKEVLSSAAGVLGDEADCLERMAEGILDGKAVFDEQGILGIEVDVIEHQHIALQRRLIRNAFKRVLGKGRALSFNHVERVLSLLGDGGNREVHLPGGTRARKEYGMLKFYPAKKGPEGPEGYEHLMTIPGLTLIPEARIVIEAKIQNTNDITKIRWDDLPSNTAYVDLDLIQPPVRVRSRRQGDWFYPIGLGGKKTLKDFFISLKIPREQRHVTPIVVNGDDSIIWVAGLRLDERFKLTHNTMKTLCFKVSQMLPNTR